MMTEQHIEELRAELRNAWHVFECREIEGELEMALAELEIIEAEQDGIIDAKPPF